MQWLYLLAAIVGTALPLSRLIPFLKTHGLDLPLFFEQLFAEPRLRVLCVGCNHLISRVVAVRFLGRTSPQNEQSVAVHRLQLNRRRIIGAAAVPVRARTKDWASRASTRITFESPRANALKRARHLSVPPG